jgi:Metal-independent alpha-mannosidase (GH125)
MPPRLPSPSASSANKGIIITCLAFLLFVLFYTQSAMYPPDETTTQPILPSPCQDCPLSKPRPPRIPLHLPNARPMVAKRKFTSDAIEQVVQRVTAVMADRDLAALFRNCYPNTLDTTIAWFHDDRANDYKRPRSFIVTGDSKLSNVDIKGL